jgi:ParB family chromosome partitioning protein
LIPIQNQPRKQFDEEKMNELAEFHTNTWCGSANYIVPSGSRYRLVAGERRWRASRAANKTTIPAIVLDLNEKEVMEISLMENLQREDLNPIEEAKGIQVMMETV